MNHRNDIGIGRKRGRRKVNNAELEEELQIKREIVSRMQKSFSSLEKYSQKQMICDSDLEEYDDIFSTDEESTDIDIEMAHSPIQLEANNTNVEDAQQVFVFTVATELIQI